MWLQLLLLVIPANSKPWPLPNSSLCAHSYKPRDADLNGLVRYTDGDTWIRLVETDNNCDNSHELSKFGIKCNMDKHSHMKVLQFAAAVYTISQQVWLPPSTVIQGMANPNVPGDPRSRPVLSKHTLFVPGDWQCNPTQATSWASFPMYNSYLKCLRKGFLMNTDTVLRNFIAQGASEDGQGLGMGLSGGGLIELPGCGTSYVSAAGCGGPDEKYDDVPHLKFPNKTFWTGYDGGVAVRNVLAENLRLNDLKAEDSSNVGFWSSMTTDNSAHTNITLRKIVCMRTNQDGVNVHGSVVDWSGSDLHFENTGDDVFAVWGAGADTRTSGMGSGKCPKMTNAPATRVSFDRIFARQKSGGSYGTCLSIFGSRQVTADRMLCCEEHDENDRQGLFNIEQDFCSRYPHGVTNITVTRASWFSGERDLCRGNEDQFQDDMGLDGHSLSGDSKLCTGSSGKGLCGSGCSWANDSFVDSRKIRVHIVAHTHDDPGWIKTADQYFDQEVHALLNNSIASLLSNSSRIFHYVEMVYFKRWWGMQSTSVQTSVRELVAAGRLVFLTGGLCMNDEAGTHVGAIVDQMTWGHRFLNDTFGPSALPTVSWQIDPYGHSAAYADLVQAMGFDAFVGQKISNQVHDLRAANKSLEFEWIPSGYTPGLVRPMIGHILYDNTDGYSFTFKKGVFDDPTKASFNIHKVARRVVDSVVTRLQRYRHDSDVLFLYGSDFAFQDAPKPFVEMEKVMRWINNRPDEYAVNGRPIELLYSTPSNYFERVRAAATANPRLDGLPVEHGDFFPASFTNHYIRSGYFSSRNAQKASDRALWSTTNAATTLRAWHGAGDSTNAEALDRAIGVAVAAVGIHQHHDAITGTDYANVAEDYVARLARARTALDQPAAHAALAATGLDAKGGTCCSERNVSVCVATDALKAVNGSVDVVVFNPLAHRREREVVAVPVPVDRVVVIDKASGAVIPSEVHRSVLADISRPEHTQWTLWMAVDNLKPLEARALTLHVGDKHAAPPIPATTVTTDTALDLRGVGGGACVVSGTTGSLVNMSMGVGGEWVEVSSALGYYVPDMGNANSTKDNPCSTAYAFRPREQHPTLFTGPALSIVQSKGALVQQTSATLRPHPNAITMVTRVVAGDKAVRLLWGLGPLSVANGDGEEAVLRVAAPAIESRGVFYTDANGMGMRKRVRQLTNKSTSPIRIYEPVAQNFYPATSIAAVRSEGAGGAAPGLALTFDASHATGSPVDGSLELLLQRRHADRGCRIDEGYELDDVHPVIGEARLHLTSDDSLAQSYRLGSLHSTHPPFVALQEGSSEVATEKININAYTSPALPPSLHLHTLARVDASLICDPFSSCEQSAHANDFAASEQDDAPGTRATLLLRLRHLYDPVEEPVLGVPVSVNVTALLSARWRLLRMDAVTLTGSRSVQRDVSALVTVYPMQIQTFKLDVEREFLP